MAVDSVMKLDEFCSLLCLERDKNEYSDDRLLHTQ